MLPRLLCLASVALALLVSASPVQEHVRASKELTSVHTVFESKRQADMKLRFVRDSGVCETTPGVGQISGYIDIGPNMSTVRPMI